MLLQCAAGPTLGGSPLVPLIIKIIALKTRLISTQGVLSQQLIEEAVPLKLSFINKQQSIKRVSNLLRLMIKITVLKDKFFALSAFLPEKFNFSSVYPILSPDTSAP